MAERTPKERCSNLKPLEEDRHGTGKWNFRGHNLSPEEVEVLTAKGVDWEVDVMPDGRLKLPKFRLASMAKRKKARALRQVQLKTEQEELKKKYDQIPEPKPGFFEWAFKQEEHLFYDILRKIGRMPNSTPTEKIRAIGTLTEYSKSKPKAQLELANKAPDFEQMPVEELLRMLLETIGINWDRFREWCNSENFQISIH